MRIAMIGPFGLAPKGTMRYRALPLARALAAAGHAVTIIMPPWQTPREPPRTWMQDGVTLQHVSLAPRWPGLPHILIARRLLARALAWQPDVVHCFKPKAHSGLAAWLLAGMPRLGGPRPRLVIDADDWEGPGGWNDLAPYTALQRALFARQERWGLRRADALTVASRTLQSLAWSLGVPPARVHYLPNGAPSVGAGDGAATRRRLGLGDDPVVLLYTRFFEFSPERALDTYLRIRREVPRARLLVVGRALFPAHDAAFDRLAAEASAQAAVTRAGWVEPEELPGHLAAADIALYPFDDTLVNRAKCAVKLAEMLAAGIAVVADAVGQNAEYILHNETGLLVPGGDREAMAAAAVRLLRDAALRRRLSAAARRRMAVDYAWEWLAESALSAYMAPEASKRH